jgi:hypothetical protein
MGTRGKEILKHFFATGPLKHFVADASARAQARSVFFSPDARRKTGILLKGLDKIADIIEAGLKGNVQYG